MENVVKRIVIEKLYDLYDYDITFDRGGITLLTGPNGYGKTTILNIVRNALQLKFWYFYRLLYSDIKIYWGDDTMLSFSKYHIQKNESEVESLNDRLAYTQLFPVSEIDDYEVKVRHCGEGGRVMDSCTLNKERAMDIHSRVMRGHFSIHDFRSDIDQLYDLIDRHSEIEYKQLGKFSDMRSFAQRYTSMYVNAQRIFTTTRVHYDDEIVKVEDKYTITELAGKVKEMYQREQHSYVEKSQQIDSTFIQRLIKKKKESYQPEEYQKKLDTLKEKIASFERYGLVENFNLVEDYNNKLSTVLSMHIDDLNDKLSVYDRFYEKLALFDRFVSGKGLSNKRMVLDSKHGITVMSDTDREIPLHKLSSGEQNIVILCYRLVFETNNETLLLIDEPENSIHIAWLKVMLNDYLEMVSKLDCQMLIATHSVAFVDGHWDISFDLYRNSFQNA